MLLLKAIKQEIKQAKKLRLTWQAKLVWAGVCVLVIGLLDHFGRTDLALPVLNTVGILGFFIALNWKLRGRTWFWGITIILSALHALLILYIPWTTRWVPAMAIAAIDSADLIVMLTILLVVGKFMGRAEIC